MQFKKVSEVDVNPTWPNHTGTVTWEWEGYRVVETRYGGMNCKTEYRLLNPTGEVLGVWWSHYYKEESLKNFVTRLVSADQEKRNE